jgi:hypothetical protein
MTDAMEESGTADSGDTVSLVDTGLGAADESFWVSAWVAFTSGANDGEVRKVSAFNAITEQLTWVTPLGTAVSAGDTFTVTFFYISGLTNGAVNYIYIRESPALLNGYGIATFVATTSSTPAGSDLLVATATLDGGGVVTASDNSPTNAKRLIYPGVGRGEIDTETASYTNLPASSFVDVTISHDDFLFIGGRTIAVTGVGVTAAMQEHYKSDECVVRVTNGSSYTRSGTVTVTIQGRHLLTL